MGLVPEQGIVYWSHQLGVEDGLSVQRSWYWFLPGLEHSFHAASRGFVD